MTIPTHQRPPATTCLSLAALLRLLRPERAHTCPPFGPAWALAGYGRGADLSMLPQAEVRPERAQF